MLSKVFLLTKRILTTIGAQAWLKKVDSFSLKYFSTTWAIVHNYTRVKIFVELALGRKKARKEQELEAEAKISSISGLKCRLKVRPKRLNFFFKETKTVAWQIFKKNYLSRFFLFLSPESNYLVSLTCLCSELQELWNLVVAAQMH